MTAGESWLAFGPVVIAIGAIGFWRWSMWLAKRIPALFYRPITNDHDCTATVVATVFQEDPELFRRAVRSWIANRPERIIAVIDSSDGRCLRVAQSFPEVEILINHQPGKRPGLALGVDASDTDIVVLVDSDVLWAPDVLRKLKMPFADPAIGGVSARAFMTPTDGVNPTLWERLADMYLDLRFSTEVAATSRWGGAVSCLSGRTSAYRTPLLRECRDALLGETFLGRACISGDDKRYTSLVLQKGHRTWYQLDAHVHSTFKPDFAGFTRQRLRWFRNSFRSDLRALGARWIWRHPYLALVLLDKNLAVFTQLNGIVFLVLAIRWGNWSGVAGLALWWLVSRALKLAPHLRRKPGDWVLLPAFIVVTFFLSLLKLYALATLNRQGWLSRPVEMVGGKIIRTGAAA